MNRSSTPRRERRYEPRLHALENLPLAIETRAAATAGLWVAIAVSEGRLLLRCPTIGAERIVLDKGAVIAFPANNEFRGEFLTPGFCAVGYLDRDPLSDLWQRRAPHPAAPGQAVMIDEALILKIVLTFYARICGDALLAAQFLDVIADWPAHLRRLCHFWSSVTLLTGAYKGDVLEAHRHLPDLTSVHFERWLALFDETVRAFCVPDQANIFRARALRIAARIEDNSESERLKPAVRSFI